MLTVPLHSRVLGTYALTKGCGKVLKNDVRICLRHRAEAILDVVPEHTVLYAKVGRRAVWKVRDDKAV